MHNICHVEKEYVGEGHAIDESGLIAKIERVGVLFDIVLLLAHFNCRRIGLAFAIDPSRQ